MAADLHGHADPSDAAVVRAALAGDASAFDVLVLRYQPLVDAYARHLLDQAPAAEDLVQESFLRAYRALATLEEPERFGGWLKSIVWRACRDWVRGQRAARPLPELAAAEILGDAAPEPHEDDPWLVRLAEAIDAMHDGTRVALALFYVLEVPQERIARFLEVPLGTIKRRLFDGRREVAAVADGGPEPLDMPSRRRFVAELRRLLARHAPGGIP